ncbi:MAG: delta-60 repeat domain-containing protein [Verrucomicrobia bacterium]|nr:delta-60 repeat domain-containing protein [Verrucomicrobiota bacterium]
MHDLALQADGRVVVVGSFTEILGVSQNRIARLNTDGSLNTSFDPGTGANGVIRAVALQSDGKLVIGGDFTAYNGITRNRLARLNTDGSLDAGFVPGTGMNNNVQDVIVDGSGRILVGGQFTQVAGTTQRYLARLTATGALDPFFNMAVGFNNTVNALAIQPDGRILAAGAFTTVNQIGRVRIARLGEDASVDLSFDPGSGPSSTLLAVAAPSDGNVLIGGQFTSVAGQNRRYVARLNADGGSATSTAPQMVVSPAAQQVNAGLSASFTVVAGGSPPPTINGRSMATRCQEARTAP